MPLKPLTKMLGGLFSALNKIDFLAYQYLYLIVLRQLIIWIWNSNIMIIKFKQRCGILDP